MAVRRKKLSPKQKRKKDIKLIVKANQLVEAKYMFDIWEMRVFLSLVSLISTYDDDEKVYRIWFKDIKNNFKIKTKSYKFFRDAVDRLFEKSLVIGYMKDGYEREKKHHLIRSTDALKSGQEGINIEHQEYIDVKIDSEIRPYLLDIRKRFDPAKDRYTSYELRNVIDLQSYGIRIYELLKQFENLGSRVIKIQALKDAFNITNEYPRFSNFYQKVIKKSIKDINEKTDITVPLDRIEKIKKGRKIEALRFFILSKNRKELTKLRGEEEPKQRNLFDMEDVEVIELEQEQTEADALYKEFEEVVVKDFGVTPSVFIKMLVSGQYSKEAIEQAIAVTRRAKFNQEIKKSIAGFFVRGLQQGFTDEKIEKQKKGKKEKNKLHKLQKQLEKIELEYAKKKDERIKLLLQEQEGVNEIILLYVKENNAYQIKSRAKKLKIDFDTLTVQHFRDDKILREIFVQGIFSKYQKYFANLEDAYKSEILNVNSQF